MSLRAGILGVGAVGARVARQLLAGDQDAEVVLADSDPSALELATRNLGPRASVLVDGRLHDQGIDVLIVAAPCGHHVGPVRRALRAGVPSISASDRIEDVEALYALDAEARAAKVAVLVGVAFAPGLSCVLASYAANAFDVVDEIHVAKAGTGGPACARQHHRALKGSARDWRDGGWIRRPGGSGRELVWFPDPVSGADCYRAALPDALVLRGRFPESQRITARIAATRQDRFTSWLPMLSPPHPEGGVGAVRVELRGRIGARRDVRIVGAVERPAIGAAAVVAAATMWLHREASIIGVRGLAEAVEPSAFLRDVAARGLRGQEFVGLATL